MYKENFSQKLKKSRIDIGYTQKEVEEITKISQSRLSHYENGRSEPSIEELGILIDLYEISGTWLIGTKK